MKYTKITLPENRRIDAAKWAREHIGRSKGENGELPWHEMIWYRSSIKEGYAFYFRNPEHATLFALRGS